MPSANDAEGHAHPAAEVLKFTATAALLAIFVDAAIGHAMLWGNDPYWTYWVTDTLLMATVFGIGTAWFGKGLVQGALITAVHMLLLTTYYWSLSPIGLPGHPEWLDLEHTWITGLPVHFAVYYLGYVLALWLWRRRGTAAAAGPAAAGAGRLALLALAVAAGIVVMLGVVQTLLLGTFPGVTWFVMRIAVAFPFTLAWWVLAGRDRAAAVAGGIVLGLLLTTYGHYLGPVGLPNPELRLLAEDPPPAVVHWLSYREEFLVFLPVAVVVAVASLLLVSQRHRSERAWGRNWLIGAGGSLFALLCLGAVTALHTGPEANAAIVTAEGPARIGQVAGEDDALRAATATLELRVENRNGRRTPLAPHDLVALEATVTAGDGASYTIAATEPMVADPLGRFTTWWGVGFNVWHHGRSGIGAADLPATHSNVAVHALGTVSAAGEVVASGVPMHVLTTARQGARLELHVGDPAFPLPAIAGGHLRIVWPEHEGGYDRAADYARYAWGSGVLLVLLGFALAAARRQEPLP